MNEGDGEISTYLLYLRMKTDASRLVLVIDSPWSFSAKVLIHSSSNLRDPSGIADSQASLQMS